MATDKNGKTIQIGDVILVRARVSAVGGIGERVNVMAYVEPPLIGSEWNLPTLLLHNTQVEVVE